MNPTLRNTEFRDDGIFGELLNADDIVIAVTLQHAYPSGHGDGSYLPKIPPGTYTCIRGQHQLAHMSAPFTTFEITGVKGHTNLLFHAGNYNKDSDGCVLLGRELIGKAQEQMITGSRETFEKFMNLMQGIDQFTLTVR